MEYDMIGAIEYVIKSKTERYNKAMDEMRTRDATECLYQLKGIQEVLQAMGIRMGMDKGQHTGWNLVCSIER